MVVKVAGLRVSPMLLAERAQPEGPGQSLKDKEGVNVTLCFFLLVYKPEERVPFVRDYFQRWINIKFNNIGTLLQSHRIQ